MTYVQAINEVLRRLRENQTSSPTATEYTTHIGALVNEAKREVEDAWDWTALRQTVTITTSNGTSQQVLDLSVQETGRDNQRYKILSVYDNTNDAWLRLGEKNRLKFLIDDGQTGQPEWYYVEDVDSNLDPYINFYLVPDGAYSIQFNLLLPQTTLTTGTDNILVPDWPVVMGAYAKAVAERGEDDGRSSGEVYAAYDRALADAIIQDSTRVHESELVFYVG